MVNLYEKWQRKFVRQCRVSHQRAGVQGQVWFTAADVQMIGRLPTELIA